MKVGEVKAFGYTGGIQQFEFETNGVYKLEVWGASSGSGERGGYSVGYKTFKRGDKIYICCGGQGQYGTATYSGEYGNYVRYGGYNGGGNGNQFNATNDDHRANYGGGGSGGGGATHMALVSGTLTQIGKTTFDLKGLLVAGGAGGGTNSIGAGYGVNGNGGTGGGASGGSRSSREGNQEDGLERDQWIASGTYAFGQGGAFAGGGYYGGASGGASGWWGSGGGSGSATGGGGGTGWIGGVSTIIVKRKSYSPSTSNGANSGHGRAQITLIDKTVPSILLGVEIDAIYLCETDIDDVFLGTKEFE